MFLFQFIGISYKFLYKYPIKGNSRSEYYELCSIDFEQQGEAEPNDSEFLNPPFWVNSKVIQVNAFLY